MCRKKKNSDCEETVFGKGSRIFIGLLSAALVCLLIEIIYAAIKMHEINGRLGSKESFLEILMRVLGFAFPVKTLAIGLVFGVVWYVYSKRRKDINDAMEAAEEEKAAEEAAAKNLQKVQKAQRAQRAAAQIRLQQHTTRFSRVSTVRLLTQMKRSL